MSVIGRIEKAQTEKEICSILDIEGIQYILCNTKEVWWLLHFIYGDSVYFVEKRSASCSPQYLNLFCQIHFRSWEFGRRGVKPIVTDMRERIESAVDSVNYYGDSLPKILIKEDMEVIWNYSESEREKTMKLVAGCKGLIIELTEEIHNLEFWLNQLEE